MKIGRFIRSTLGPVVASMVAGNRRAPAGKPVGAFSSGQQAVARVEREFDRYLGCGIAEYYE
jgi:hypothetical protein